MLLITLGWRALAPITLNPVDDMNRLGLFASLWAYGVALMRSSAPAPEQSPFYQLAHHLKEDHRTPLHGDASSEARPNVVLVQSESFFDPRPWYADVSGSLLTHFDATRKQALEHGELSVPAWGANTVRTECAVLTGLSPSAWGPRQFNPYRTLSRHPLPSLASTFQAAGYRTVCIHPYPASFYMRHKVIPLLGFDQFIDISSFESSDKQGQYIGDLAVARKVGRLLEDSDNRPFCIRHYHGKPWPATLGSASARKFSGYAAHSALATAHAHARFICVFAPFGRGRQNAGQCQNRPE